MQAANENIEITKGSKKEQLIKIKQLSPSITNLTIIIHHMEIDEEVAKHLNFSFKNLDSLKLVFYGCKLAHSVKFPECIWFKQLPKLAHLKLNFGCMDLSSTFLKDLKRGLDGLELETFDLKIPNAGISSHDLDNLINKDFIKLTKIKRFGLNLLKVLPQKGKISLKNIGGILEEVGARMERLSLNVSQNELTDVDEFQKGLLEISGSKKIKLKLIMYNCLMNQKPILQICDTLLKFDNLEEVKLDIRENYDVKKEYPSCKVISYCETLICAFRHMLAFGDDSEQNRKYKVCY